MAAPMPRTAGPLHLLARARRAWTVTMLRRHYMQQSQLAAQMEQQLEQLAVEQLALRRSLRNLGEQLRSLGELPPHLPDHIEQGQPRCEP